MLHFPRTSLATDLTIALQGKSTFGDASNGLFLAAPRRTGKSTFLQADLKPALEKEGIIFVYVDLWADLRRDPGVLIADAIRRVLDEKRGILTKTIKATGLAEVTIPGLGSLDTTRIGATSSETLVEVLRTFTVVGKAPVALIIDEAQHALTSDAGEAAMAALKSARDQLNRPGKAQLMLVMSGSDRDKLLRLVNTNGSPFFGSSVQKMPELDAGFIDFVATLMETQRRELRPVDQETLMQAFQLFGNRPQFFMEALGQALSPLAGGQKPVEQEVLEMARQSQRADEAQMESEYLALKPVERAVLWRLLEQGPRFRPYDSEALHFYTEKTGKKVTPAQAQNALEALRERTPALVWKSARSEYAVDDAAMNSWFQKRKLEETWPPSPTEPAAAPSRSW